QPGRKFFREAVRRREAVGAEEHLLPDGLDVLDVAQHAVEVTEDRRAVAFVDDRERLAVAVLGAAHEFFIAGAAQGLGFGFRGGGGGGLVGARRDRRLGTRRLLARGRGATLH